MFYVKSFVIRIFGSYLFISFGLRVYGINFLFFFICFMLCYKFVYVIIFDNIFLLFFV